MCDREGGGGESGGGLLQEQCREGSRDHSQGAREATRELCQGREGTGGVLLSVSALAGAGQTKAEEGRKREEGGSRREVCSNCDGVRMGQGGSAGGEGGEEVQDSGELERVKEELAAALAELDKKEEQVTKLSGIRDQVEAELQELTASLFQVNSVHLAHCTFCT